MNVDSAMAAQSLKVLLSMAFTLPLLAASVPAAKPSYRPQYSKPPARAQSFMSADQLYAIRARRRAAVLLRLELLELRKAQLERVKAAVEGTLPLDEVLGKPAK